MKLLLPILSATLLAPACVAPTNAPEADPKPNLYRIDGDLSAALVSGEFVIFDPAAPKTAATGMAAAATSISGATLSGATMSTGMSSSAAPEVAGEIARASLVDGKFTIEGELDAVTPVHFYVLDARSAEGHRMAPTKGQAFILEPGELVLTMNAKHKFLVEGGKYNDAVYNVWRATPEYAEAEARMYSLYREVPGETEEQAKARLEEARKAQELVFDLEAKGRQRTATTHPDILARKLAIQTVWLGGPWMLDAARSILEMDPNDAWARDFVQKQLEFAAQRARNAETGRVGGTYQDFETTTLDGEAISLSGVCADNKFVLLEFWASWCGPCRNEIPHMKKAYARYKAKGFEILSFTIDDDRDAWAKASAQEELPWIDTGYGLESEPKKLYEVMGVPANYLIDASTGRVVARNLRGHALDDKLAELLGE